MLCSRFAYDANFCICIKYGTALTMKWLMHPLKPRGYLFCATVTNPCACWVHFVWLPSCLSCFFLSLLVSPSEIFFIIQSKVTQSKVWFGRVEGSFFCCCWASTACFWSFFSLCPLHKCEIAFCFKERSKDIIIMLMCDVLSRKPLPLPCPFPHKHTFMLILFPPLSPHLYPHLPQRKINV